MPDADRIERLETIVRSLNQQLTELRAEVAALSGAPHSDGARRPAASAPPSARPGETVGKLRHCAASLDPLALMASTRTPIHPRRAHRKKAWKNALHGARGLRHQPSPPTSLR